LGFRAQKAAIRPFTDRIFFEYLSTLVDKMLLAYTSKLTTFLDSFKSFMSLQFFCKKLILIFKPRSIEQNNYSYYNKLISLGYKLTYQNHKDFLYEKQN